MQTVNLHDANANLTRLIEVIESGEDVVIARNGEPVAKLTAYKRTSRPIAPPGSLEGQIWMADDFNAPLDDLFKVFDEKDGTDAK